MTEHDEDITIPDSKVAQIRERVLAAEKNKLSLDNPRGINNEMEEIIEEEIN